jgi:hypothetical protein
MVRIFQSQQIPKLLIRREKKDTEQEVLKKQANKKEN